ncbi:hypothetical protein QWY90_04280 [Flavobacterium paronense]|uniref:Uncharacterized protein n=1 Tax=Flavobacterium paronense TaxID=1392775 RepID=A0ABV5GIA6_9FLAO|nr:hypothetical protein [Flavobacterium paronense]MDN3676523.1 hypothetical protein [Flavobacterium paronense]
MKKIIFYALTLSVFVFGSAFAQTVAEQNLSSAIQSAENIKQEVTVSRKAVNQLVKQLTIIRNPNIVLFATIMTNSNDEKETNANNVDYYVATAQSSSSIAFSTALINDLTAKILQQNDVVYLLTNQIVTAVNSGNNSLALNLVTPLRSALTKQFNFARNIITNVQELQVLNKTYNVCIKVVDSQGNTTSYQPGFYAVNTLTGEYLYPNNDQGNQNGGDCFLNLPKGTYNFGGFQDYFCGVTSIGPIVLSDSLLNQNGIIEVTLVLWCE